MSRHRDVRNLDIDAVLEEDDYGDDYDENELDETQLSNEDLEKLEQGVAHVFSVIGDDAPLSGTEIKEALWYYYFDEEEAVNWALGTFVVVKKKFEANETIEKVSKIKKDEEKQRKAKAAKASGAMQRKPHFRRPPAKLYEEKQVTSLLQSMSSRSGGSSLSQLRQKMTQQTPFQAPIVQLPSSSAPKPGSLLSLARQHKEENKHTSPSKPVGSLATLAQRSTGAKKQSALQALASRKGTPAESSVGTTGLTAASVPQNLRKGTSLAHLALRLRPVDVSENQPVKSTPISKEPVHVDPPKGDTIPLPKMETSLLPQKNEQVRSNQIRVDIPPNPLCAPPSEAALFLFMPPEPAETKDDCVPPTASSSPDTFATSTTNIIQPFSFDVPSPDDVALAAQSHRSGGKAKE